MTFLCFHFIPDKEGKSLKYGCEFFREKINKFIVMRKIEKIFNDHKFMFYLFRVKE